jgi:hypothetical protein
VCGQLPHVHLVSTYRFPHLPHLPIETAVEYLLHAPGVVKGHAPMTWTFLDAPQDGTIMLVWQPSKLGNQFASDGYIWADPEIGHTLNARNCVSSWDSRCILETNDTPKNLEVFIHQSGFAPGREMVAVHARRRYRIMGSSDPNVAIDSSLWIVHYGPSESNARIPASRISMSSQIQQLLSTRRHLQSHGQLVRREFMLHDQTNWPTIGIPGGPPAAQVGLPQGNNQLGPTGRSGGQYFTPQHPGQMAGPSPAKRQRQVGPAHGAAAGIPIPPGVLRDPTIDDDEDTSRGDLLDHMSPREMSVVRYKQHHEWMEEIISSPYDIKQILPVSLGLVLPGDLEAVTKGFFETPPTDVESDILTKPRALPVGSLPTRESHITPEKFQAFHNLAQDKIAALNEDMKQMKKKHSAKMNRLHGVAKFSEGELTLRHAVYDPLRKSPEFWQDRDEASKPAEGETTNDMEHKVLVESLVSSIEQHVGKRIGPSLPVRLVQKGGLQDAPIVEPMPEPELDLEAEQLTHFDPTSSLEMHQFDGPPTTEAEAHGDKLEESTPLGFDDVQMPDMGDVGQLAESTDLSHDFAIDGQDNFDTGNTIPSGNGNNGAGSADGDIDMHNSAAGLLDQYYTSEPSSPGQNLSTPQAQSTLGHSEAVNTSTADFHSASQANPQENAEAHETMVQQGRSTEGT